MATLRVTAGEHPDYAFKKHLFGVFSFILRKCFFSLEIVRWICSFCSLFWNEVRQDMTRRDEKMISDQMNFYWSLRENWVVTAANHRDGRVLESKVNELKKDGSGGKKVPIKGNSSSVIHSVLQDVRKKIPWLTVLTHLLLSFYVFYLP